MADITLVIDPAGSSFALHDRANGRSVMGLSVPVPDTKSQWASSIDTEGDRRAVLGYTNRLITVSLLLQKSTAALLETLENQLGVKIGKLAREGGVLRFTTPAGTTVYFDVEEASMQRVWDPASVVMNRCQYEVTFICRPFGYGDEVELGTDTVETTLPYLVKTVTGPVGDVPALGRLLIDNDQAVDQWWLTWGLESRYYSSSANALLFYEAEGRTALGGSATAVGPTGASGGGSNVMRNTALATDYLAIMSTQATAAGAHLSHVGTFRWYARVQVPTANTGLVTIAGEWAEADFLRYTRNQATTIPAAHEGRWRLVDLGLVTLRTVTAGTQRWEGRIVAKSTVSGDDIDIDYLLLVPAVEGSGIVSGVNRPFTPTSYSALDEFTATTSGVALNARVAPTGGTWATSGDATDFAFSDIIGETARRAATAGTNGRFAILGSTNYTGVEVRAKVYIDSYGGASSELNGGVIARWTDSSNYVRATMTFVADAVPTVTLSFQVTQVLAGTATVIASVPLTLGMFADASWPVDLYPVRLLVYANGAVRAELYHAVTGALIVSTEGGSSDLASGGTLATGKPGLFDRNTGANAAIRHYDDFSVATMPPDAAAFASQSIEIRHDRVVREDSGGTLWTTPSSYTGDYLLIPPTGAEGRSTRVIVKGTRTDPEIGDPAIDDISARLFATPRFLAMPD